MKNHTPTPWKFVSGSMNNLRTVEYCHENHLGDAVQINIGHIHESKDADFIARAVNSFDDLLDIAKLALEVAESGDSFRTGIKGIHRGVADRIKKVVQQATKGGVS